MPASRAWLLFYQVPRKDRISGVRQWRDFSWRCPSQDPLIISNNAHAPKHLQTSDTVMCNSQTSPSQATAPAGSSSFWPLSSSKNTWRASRIDYRHLFTRGSFRNQAYGSIGTLHLAFLKNTSVGRVLANQIIRAMELIPSDSLLWPSPRKEETSCNKQPNFNSPVAFHYFCLV